MSDISIRSRLVHHKRRDFRIKFRRQVLEHRTIRRSEENRRLQMAELEREARLDKLRLSAQRCLGVDVMPVVNRRFAFHTEVGLSRVWSTRLG